METRDSVEPSKEVCYDIKHEIGSGAYGKVYHAVKSDGMEVAVKKIAVGNEGIPCLLEATIMASIKHPNVNHAMHIFSCDSKLNIVQEEAISDLLKHTRNRISPLSVVRKWAHQIAGAVYVFHRLGFVHADIKASNILYFRGDRVKLADYTLIVKMWHPKDKFLFCAGTNTHCAPEVLLGQLWNRSIDIWSLGCTMYQMAFGKYLFNTQQKDDTKRDNKLRYHNAIASFFGLKTVGGISFVPPDAESLLYTSEYAVFRDLLFRMLRYRPEERLNIDAVLNHPFFTGMTRVLPIVLSGQPKTIKGRKLETITGIVLRMLRGCVKFYTEQEVSYMSEIAIETYKRVQSLDTSTVLREAILAGCCLIGAKIVLGRLGEEFNLNTELIMDRVYSMEMEICTYLSYCIPIGYKEMPLD